MLLLIFDAQKIESKDYASPAATTCSGHELTARANTVPIDRINSPIHLPVPLAKCTTETIERPTSKLKQRVHRLC